MITANNTFDWSKAPHPLHSANIRVTNSTRAALFDRLNKFAGEHRLDVRISRIHSSKEQFGVDLWRNDVAIAGENVFDELVFGFGFYANTGVPMSEASLNTLRQQFKQAVEEIPGVTYTVTE